MIKKITSIDDLSIKEINKIADDAIKYSLNKKKTLYNQSNLTLVFLI